MVSASSAIAAWQKGDDLFPWRTGVPSRVLLKDDEEAYSPDKE